MCPPVNTHKLRRTLHWLEPKTIELVGVSLFVRWFHLIAGYIFYKFPVIPVHVSQNDCTHLYTKTWHSLKAVSFSGLRARQFMIPTVPKCDSATSTNRGFDLRISGGLFTAESAWEWLGHILERSNSVGSSRKWHRTWVPQDYKIPQVCHWNSVCKRRIS